VRKLFIVRAKVVHHGYPNKSVVEVAYDDGTTEDVVRFYPDELTFCGREFIGLTREEAQHLFYKKDVEYLRSED
jgi:hypothetical protein